MEKTFTFDMASKAYADYILNSKDRYAPLIVEIPEGRTSSLWLLI